MDSPTLRVYPSSLWVEDAEGLFHCRYPGCEFDPTDDMGQMLSHIDIEHPLKLIECPCKLRIKLEGEDLCSVCKKAAERQPAPAAPVKEVPSDIYEQKEKSEEVEMAKAKCSRCGKNVHRGRCKKEDLPEKQTIKAPERKQETKKSGGGMLPPVGKVFYKAEETEVDYELLTGGKLHITFIGGKVASAEVREDEEAKD